MHEHHEEEMTPSALSYQLRDTISQQTLKAFARNATDYELVEPALRIAANGYVEHL